MNLEHELARRLTEDDLLMLNYMVAIERGDGRKCKLYDLIYHSDKQIAENAVLVFTRMLDDELVWLLPKRQELMRETIATQSERKRRLLMTLLYRLPWDASHFHAGFLDYCLETIPSAKASVAVRVLAMKLAFEQCRHSPELMHELRAIVDLLDAETMWPSMRAARRNLFGGKDYRG